MFLNPHKKPKPNHFLRLSGFTLIEMLIAIVILGITVGVFSRGLQNVSEKSVVPMVLLQASWIAESYLNEISFRSKNELGGCSNGPRLSEKNILNPRKAFVSICDYLSKQPMLVYDDSGELIEALRDYRVQIFLESDDLVDSKINKKFNLSIESNEKEKIDYLDSEYVVYRVIVKVFHPAIPDFSMERWIWV